MPRPSFAKPFSSEDELNALVAEMDPDGEEISSPPPDPNADDFDFDWEPSLNPTQRRIYDDRESWFILAYGELASGKSIGALHKLVRHCFENWNALALIIIEVRSQAEEGGAWHKLKTEVLPTWQQGRRIKFSAEACNSQKHLFIWISNRHGGWSRVTLMSMPVDSFVKKRAKGQEPSFVLMDEAQTMGSRTYFTSFSQRLRRRKGIQAAEQQIVFCCNPEGPSHWLYKLFFKDPVKPDGTWNTRYGKYHVPIAENRHNLDESYYQMVLESVRDDPVEEARMVRGEWVDRPTGDALFLGFFVAARHIRPAQQIAYRPGVVRRTVKGVLPLVGFPPTVSYDLGAAHSMIFFEQLITLTTKNIWLIFDEIDYVGEYVSYKNLAPKVLRRMAYWDKRVDKDKPFEWQHISDNSAFNQYRASDGSYDVLDFEKHSEGKIRMRECPKPRNSKSARLVMLRGKCTRDEIIVSAACPSAIAMFTHLESEKADPNKPYDPDVGLKPKEKSPWIHRFDAMTYAMLFFDLGGVYRPDEQKSVPQVYHMA